MFRPSYLEVSREALRENLRIIRALQPEGTAVIAVVKADAYGHGAPAVAEIMRSEGVSLLAVANLYEVRQLREAGCLKRECGKKIGKWRIVE